MKDDPELLCPDDAAWDAWLADHHTAEHGVWLVLAKKGGYVATLAQQEAVMTALCWGWIDGQVGKRDDATYRQRFTRRRARSIWSQQNVDNVARLTAEGRMRPSGLLEVEKAQSDGRWQAAYQRQSSREVPADLASELAGNPSAAAAFAAFSSQNRYAVVHRVVSAVRPETRAKRVVDLVRKVGEGWVPYP